MCTDGYATGIVFSTTASYTFGSDVCALLDRLPCSHRYTRHSWLEGVDGCERFRFQAVSASTPCV